MLEDIINDCLVEMKKEENKILDKKRISRDEKIGNLNRDNIKKWVNKNTGDFSEILDFKCSF